MVAILLRLIPTFGCLEEEIRAVAQRTPYPIAESLVVAPFVVVRRKGDGKKGSLEFQHQPRFYFNFSPHEV